MSHCFDMTFVSLKKTNPYVWVIFILRANLMYSVILLTSEIALAILFMFVILLCVTTDT